MRKTETRKMETRLDVGLCMEMKTEIRKLKRRCI